MLKMKWSLQKNQPKQRGHLKDPKIKEENPKSKESTQILKTWILMKNQNQGLLQHPLPLGPQLQNHQLLHLDGKDLFHHSINQHHPQVVGIGVEAQQTIGEWK